jgi:hypothetical protein
MDEIFARQMPAVERDTVVVDTMMPAGRVERNSDHRVLLGGDNSFSEFSAADGAVSWFGNRIWSYDLVHIATSAFSTHYVRYLERFDMKLLSAVAARPACVGHIDCYNDPIEILTYQSQHWLRTSFLFVPPTELMALGSLVSFRDAASVFSGDSERPFCSEAPLSQRYRQYIFDWLTGADIGQGVTWHSGSALTQEKLPEFERKTMAILNEHLFAIRLRAMGCRVIDTTWLATQLGTGEAHGVPWRLNWRDQLATRDTDPLRLKDNSGGPIVTSGAV